MDAESIVLEDTGLLAELCGPNDYNLSIIADLLGSRVLSRGNELMVESGDEGTRTLFSRLIEALTQSIEGGLPATPDLIIALHAELTPLGNRQSADEAQKAACDDFFDACVQIPGSGQTIYPRSRGQGLYLKGMALHDLSFAVGPAGTGKTYLAMAWALKDLLGKAKRKLILTRPIVEAG